MKTTKEITRISIIVAIATLFRIYIRILPNVQLLTPIVILYALNRKYIQALIISFLVIIISALFMSFGIWVLFQLLSYSFVIIFVKICDCLIPNIKIKKYITLFSSGIIYGFVITLIQCLVLTGIKSFYAFYIASLPFDLYHGLGNLLIYELVLKRISKVGKI